MNSSYWDAFFMLHNDLPREGPGAPEDVVWATGIAGLKMDARICDAGCGPGADIPALLAAAPRGHVLAIDTHPGFVKQAQARFGADPRTTILRQDMNDLEGPLDFIWSAGAVYFLGVTEALQTWRHSVANGGAIAFSQLCWFTDAPSEAARTAWADYPEMTDAAGLRAEIDAAGYRCLATRRLSDTAWENYFSPLDARIETLQRGATGALEDVLQEARAEAAVWRAERDAFGYLLCVVRPA